MKRDMDLIRQILLESESQGMHEVKVPGYGQGIIGCHLEMMADGGLVRAVTQNVAPRIICLTWDGHEFLDCIRNEHVWQRAKRRAEVRYVPLSFNMAKWLCLEDLKTMVGL